MKSKRLKALYTPEGDYVIDEFESITWELKQGEFESICALYNKTLDAKGLSCEDYNIDDFMSDIFTLFLKKLHNDELELIINDVIYEK